MKSRWWAFILNLLVAGLGFVYLRKWVLAAADFIVTIAVAFAISAWFPNYLSVAGTAIPVMNGVLAFQFAQQMNLRQQAQAAAAGPSAQS
jgi:hypothetical protein